MICNVNVGHIFIWAGSGPISDCHRCACGYVAYGDYKRIPSVASGDIHPHETIKLLRALDAHCHCYKSVMTLSELPNGSTEKA